MSVQKTVKKRIFFLVFGFFLLFFACNPNPPATCETSDDCPGVQVCVDQQCKDVVKETKKEEKSSENEVNRQEQDSDGQQQEQTTEGQSDTKQEQPPSNESQQEKTPEKQQETTTVDEKASTDDKSEKTADTQESTGDAGIHEENSVVEESGASNEASNKEVTNTSEENSEDSSHEERTNEEHSSQEGVLIKENSESTQDGGIEVVPEEQPDGSIREQGSKEELPEGQKEKDAPAKQVVLEKIEGNGSQESLVLPTKIQVPSGAFKATKRFSNTWILHGQHLDLLSELELVAKQHSATFGRADGFLLDTTTNAKQRTVTLPAKLESGHYDFYGLVNGKKQLLGDVHILVGNQRVCTKDSDCSPGTCNKTSGLCVGLVGNKGENGKDGEGGKKGEDGKDGDSCALSSSKMDSHGNTLLTIVCGSKSHEVTLAKGPKGDKGADGKDGKKGEDGKDATSMTPDANKLFVELKKVLTISDDESKQTNLVNFDKTKKKVVFRGVNVQVVNGHTDGKTDSKNGYGNLILGYNENSTSTPFSRTGSHNLIIGTYNRYDSIGGIIVGSYNTLHSGAKYSSIVSGLNSEIAGIRNVILGGRNNNIKSTAVDSVIISGNTNVISSSCATIVSGFGGEVTSDYGQITGGSRNKVTTEKWGVAVGGVSNEVKGLYAVVLGGRQHSSTGENSVIVGGHESVASGKNSVIAGGHKNNAIGANSAVCGGIEHQAHGQYSAIAGGGLNRALGKTVTVCGGNDNRPAGDNSTVHGGQTNVVNGQNSTILGGEKNVLNTNSQVKP